MIDINSIPAEQICVNAIEALIETQVPEGEQIEFKESLSESGRSPDPWMEGNSRIGERARNRILEETVAFANAHGGTLIIGIKESKSKPPVASEIKPLPRCVELADRLKLIFRDCVEPQVPRLEVLGVLTERDKGVVILRAGRSRLAPHRVIPSRVCPVRRADRCESLTMREIQEMTLNVSRGMERFDKRLVDRSERFRREFDMLATPGDAFGFRFTGLPVGEEIQFDRVYRQGKIIDDLWSQWRTVTQVRFDRCLQCPYEFPPSNWRPILRGARADIRPFGKEHLEIGYQELHCDGLLELGYAACSQLSPFDRDLALVLFTNTAAWANQIRNKASAPMAEYGLEVEVYAVGKSARVGDPNDRNLTAMINMAEGRRDYGEVDKLAPEISNIKFPRYTLDDEEAFSRLLSIFDRDFLNWLGKDVEGEEYLISE